MQTIHQPRLRRTPFGDLPAPSESRYVRATFVSAGPSEEPTRAPYEIFGLRPAIDGLGSVTHTKTPARN